MLNGFDLLLWSLDQPNRTALVCALKCSSALILLLQNGAGERSLLFGRRVCDAPAEKAKICVEAQLETVVLCDIGGDVVVGQRKSVCQIIHQTSTREHQESSISQVEDRLFVGVGAANQIRGIIGDAWQVKRAISGLEPISPASQVGGSRQKSLPAKQNSVAHC